MSAWFSLSFFCVRSYNFGWLTVYDCKAYLETNTVKNCSKFGFGGYFGSGNNFSGPSSPIKRRKQMKRANHS